MANSGDLQILSTVMDTDRKATVHQWLNKGIAEVIPARTHNKGPWVRGKSDVWDRFGPVRIISNGTEIEGVVACLSCYKVYTYKNSSQGTSNLRCHQCVPTDVNKPGPSVRNVVSTPPSIAIESSQMEYNKSEPSVITMPNQQDVLLNWNSHEQNMKHIYPKLLEDELFVDVTFCCEGRTIKAHKFVLSACSNYFLNLLKDAPIGAHPFLFMPTDVKYADLKLLVDFMYTGEVTINQDYLPRLLKLAEQFKIKGLAESQDNPTEIPSFQPETKTAKRRRVAKTTRTTPTHHDKPATNSPIYHTETVSMSTGISQFEGNNPQNILILPKSKVLTENKSESENVEDPLMQSTDEMELMPLECVDLKTEPDDNDGSPDESRHQLIYEDSIGFNE